MLKRWFMIGAVFAVIAVIGLYILPDASVRVEKGALVTPFSLPDLSGNMRKLPQGEVVLLNFWATWCPPCRQEMPSMAALHQRLKARGLKIVAVSVDKNADELARFVREYSIPFEVLHDQDNHIAQSYGVYRYPETFIIGRNGKVRDHIIGAKEWTTPQMIHMFEALLDEKKEEV